MNTLRAVPITEPHIPDEIDDEGLREILDCMTWGVTYRVSDRIAIMDPTPDMQAELGMCWVDRSCPGGAVVYFDGKPFAVQDVKWIEAQFEQTHEYKLTGVPSGRVCYPRGTDSAEYQAGA